LPKKLNIFIDVRNLRLLTSNNIKEFVYQFKHLKKQY